MIIRDSHIVQSRVARAAIGLLLASSLLGALCDEGGGPPNEGEDPSDCGCEHIKTKEVRLEIDKSEGVSQVSSWIDLGPSGELQKDFMAVCTDVNDEIMYLDAPHEAVVNYPDLDDIAWIAQQC